MADLEEGSRLLCRGNRTEVVVFTRGGAPFVRKSLLDFADVSTERRVLFREGRLQRAARGPGVVPMRDKRFEAIDELREDELKGQEKHPDEASWIERGYVNGYSLKELLAEEHRPTLEPDRCRAWIATLLSTLARVHALKGTSGQPLGLIHRDVTLGNVLIGQEGLAGSPREGHVWLNDFGLAHVEAWGALALEETLQGSPRFLSPELKAGQQPTGASDVYQAALLLAALLATHQGLPLDSLFDEGFSNPANQVARDLLQPWDAADAIAPDPKNRPNAKELAARLLI